MIKKLLTALILFNIMSFSYAKIHHFQVVATPNPVRVSQSMDLTIKALDVNGKIVQDYIGDVYIDEIGSSSTSKNNIEFPENQIISFWSADKGVKIIESGLKINALGTYKIAIYDIVQDNINGSTQVKVVGKDDLIQGEIKILTPKAGQSYQGNTLLVQGISLLNKSPIATYINGKLFSNSTTLSNGTFSINLSDVPSGSVELYVVSTVNGEVLGQSQKVKITYKNTAPYKIKLTSFQKYKVTMAFADLKRSVVNKSVGDKTKMKQLYLLVYKNLQSFSKNSQYQNYKDEIYSLMSLIKNAYSSL